MLLPLKRLLQPQQFLPLNPKIIRRNNIPAIRLPPIALRLKTPKHHRQLLAKLLPPNLLILLLPNLHKSHPPARDFAPGLVVVAIRTLLGVDESILRGGGDGGVGEDGGGEDADVGVDVAGVVDVGLRADGLEGDVGAVAAGLGLFLSACGMWFVRGAVLLTISVGFIMGNCQKLLVKRPTQRKVIFLAREGNWAFMSSAAWSLP